MLSADIWFLLLEGLRDSIYMIVTSTIFSYLLGLPIAVLLVVSRNGGLYPMPGVYRLTDILVNILRSIPFLILLILIFPVTKLIVGRTYGATATIVPLVVAGAPYVARMIESSLLEVDHGVIEAAQSMGASTWTIIFKVLLPESKPALLVGSTIATGTILGYSAMAGAVGGGGLGDISLRYGLNRYRFDVLVVTVVMLIVLVQIIQLIGMKIAHAADKRARS